uniref:Uncharacterized protein n=1 Tax=Anguilla anguilla TaxID=7936 RepID=A0A0E9QCE9_ANGAN
MQTAGRRRSVTQINRNNDIVKTVNFGVPFGCPVNTVRQSMMF